MNRYLGLILAGVFLNAIAQLCIKFGMLTVGPFAFTLKNLVPVGLKVAVNPYVLLGMVCYSVSVVVWLMVLSRVDVSYAYPLLSLGYIFVALTGKVFLDESLGLGRSVGILIICLGVYLITRSG